MTNQEEIAEENYEIAWLKAELEIAMSRWLYPNYWEYWDDQGVRDEDPTSV